MFELCEIERYKQLEEDLRTKLDASYSMYLIDENYKKAYEVLGELMAYKLIPMDDDRISLTNKVYKLGGVESSHRFQFDYRSSMSFLPKWIYRDLKERLLFEIDTISHAGIRREGAYSGEDTIPSRKMSIAITLCKTYKSIDNNIDKLKKLLILTKSSTARHLKGKSNEQIKELFKQGVYRLYTITVESNSIAQYKEVGYVLVYSAEESDSNVEAEIIPNYDNLMDNWISIKKFIKNVASILSEFIDGRLAISKYRDIAIESQKARVLKSDIAIKKQQEGIENAKKAEEASEQKEG